METIGGIRGSLEKNEGRQFTITALVHLLYHLGAFGFLGFDPLNHRSELRSSMAVAAGASLLRTRRFTLDIAVGKRSRDPISRHVSP